VNRSEKGREGEKRAEHYLRERGYTVLERRFRSRRGEIDLIAEKEDRIVFVEVKNWAYLDRGDLEYAIDRRKQQRILATSRQYLHAHPQFRHRHIGFDVVLVSPNTPEVVHYENAFTSSGARGKSFG
jgi:putative endonuclease